MIAQALQVMLFGMLGIFVVIGLIVASIRVLARWGRGKEERAE